jgi:RNA polymerase sigma-70 factor (ECF subfamily)
MALLPQPALPDSFAPYELLRQRFGFVPAIFRAQSLLPRLIEAEAQIAGAILLAPGALTRIQKETILLTVASCHRNVYCVTAHRHLLRELGVSPDRLDLLARDYRDAGLDPSDMALLDFAVKLGREVPGIDGGDIDALRAQGLTDQHVLEAILITALTRFLCTLSVGLNVEPDFDPQPMASFGQHIPRTVDSGPSVPTGGSYLRAVSRDPREFPSFAFFQESFGFVPNIFRAQTLRPDVVEAEAFVVGTVLLTNDVLSRVQKEYILLVISAANLNTYCVAVHCEMLRGLGVPDDASDQIAVDHHNADLSPADKALLDFALRVACLPRAESRGGSHSGPAELDRLRAHGFTDPQILEAVVMSSLTNFLNTLQVGLGTVPDFHPRRDFAASANLFAGDAHPTVGPAPTVDPDAECVARAVQGDVAAFEELVRRHHRQIYRTSLGVTGNAEDAEDVAQNTFLKAFQHLGSFERHARFTTWLTRIAINEALERVRARKPMESLSSDDEDRGEFRPMLVRAWVDNPEQLYQREELRSMVERALADMPVRYRMAVLLRDIEQLSTSEAASALGLAVPTLKTHLLRGRLMLREALAPHFTPRHGAVASV